MLYEVTIQEEINGLVSVTLRNTNNIFSSNIYKYEMIFGDKSFMDIMFFLTREYNIELKNIEDYYRTTFLFQYCANKFFNNILSFIDESPLYSII